MKRLIVVLVFVISAFISISWGRLGHRTVGLIAAKHLTPKAQNAINDLLGGANLADIANWADEVRGNDPAYKSTGAWHYINLPIGLTKAQFEDQVRGMQQDNVYKEVVRIEQELTQPDLVKEQKVIDLKFLVHFIGDLHQPMHVSRAEDEGGNKIQVNYNDQGTNLHSLWDTRLLEHEGLTDDGLAAKIDLATPMQIKAWQSDPLIDWLWESYQISSTLYQEVDAMSNRTITDVYYQNHIGIAENRLEKAGIRLAGVLNQIFEDGPYGGTIIPPPAAAAPRQDRPVNDIINIEPKDAMNHVNEDVQVCARVEGVKTLTDKVLLDLGGAYPNQLITVVLEDDAFKKVQVRNDKKICVKGTVILYKGKPEIVVSDAAKISVAP